MPSAIVCSSPAHGHVRPMLAVASALVNRGWRVRFVTGKPFAEAVRATGAEFVALTPEYDTLITPPESGRESLNHVKEVFFESVPAQVRLLRSMIAEAPADAIFHELAFMGPQAFLPEPAERRPLLVSCGVFPLVLSSRDTAPFGGGLPPATTAAQRLKYRMLGGFLKNVVLRPVHRAVDELFAEIGAPPRNGIFFIDLTARTDLFAEFSVPGFEYPRSDLPANVTFYGPPARALPSLGALPEWWDRLDGRPIVHVTQGTAFNDDFSRLVTPTVQALANRDVQVVVATGGRPLSGLPALPPNAFAAEYLPYDRLLERTSVLVTNGGFGTVMQGLTQGVPVVIGSGVGDQVETAARAAWSGAGINLGTRVPNEAAIADAVDRILADGSYRQAAQRLADEIAASTGAAGLVADVEQLVATRAVHASGR